MSEDASLASQIYCPRCKRSITLPSISAGSREHCPHCEIDFIISSGMIPQESKNIEDGVEGYALKSDIPAEVSRAGSFSSENRAEAEEKELELEVEEEKHTWRPMRTPPMGLFLAGTFTFPFRVRSLVCFLVLAVGTFMVLEIAYQAWYCSGFSSSGPTLFISAIFSGLTGVLFMIWFFSMSAYSLTILRDASEGIDEYRGMPSSVFLDLFEETVYVISSIFWSALPGAIIVLLLSGLWSIKLLIVIPLAMLLYPLIILSLLENQSAAVPYSKPVWRSLWYAWHAWILFYLLTLLVGETVVYLLRLISFKVFFMEIIIISILLPYFLMVYFRLLGRLAWFCSGRFEEQNPSR